MAKSNKHHAWFLVKGSPLHITVEFRDKESCAPHLDIDGNMCRTYRELSISGSHAHGCGQCTDMLAKVGKADATRLMEIWSRWHLNGMKAGTRAQQTALEQYEPAKGVDYYTGACLFLHNFGLETIPNFLPLGREPNAEDKARGITARAYKYGSAWLVEPLPAAIEEELKAICARNTKARIETDESIAARWQALDSKHDSDAVIAVREYVGGHVVEGGDVDEFDDWRGGDIDKAEELFSEYRGDWASVAEYAEEFAKDVGYLTDADNNPLMQHIDWESFGAELERDMTSIERNGRVYLFWTT